MNRQVYQRYLQAYILESIQNSDGSNRGIAEYLSTIQIGRLTFGHREERRRALADARQAFDEHRHWPLDIVLSHLGVELPK